ncbi:P-loop containing nucleoside triphosphate hydrolase protein [Schizophyllum commune]
MSDPEVAQLRELMQDLLDGKEPRDFQVELVKAQMAGRDSICQAATGMGKTAVAAGPYVLPQNASKTTLMISPLIGLQNEMVNTFQDEYKLPAIAVNSAHDTSQRCLKDIVNGKYRIVLLSPEMLLSRRFIDRVLRDRKFGTRVLSIIVDEAHCVSHWGASFRKKYGQIGTARAFLPCRIPVVALSASLTRRVRRDVLEKLQLRNRGHPMFYLNHGNDRPNVSIVVRAIHNTQSSYTDLDFVIPSNTTKAEAIPKTWIYADNINTGGEIIDHLRTLLPPELHEVIRPYNAIHGTAYRDEAMRLFKRGDVRVLVCTDAAGMGCNIPDIEVVVQWKLPEKLSSFVQRAGRAARDPRIHGLAVLLVEQSAYTVDLLARVKEESGKPTATKESSKAARGKRRRKNKKAKVPKGASKEYAKEKGRFRGGRVGNKDNFPAICQFEAPMPSHDDEAEGLYHFVQSRICRRVIMATVFDSPAPVRSTVDCCDVCWPSLLDRTRPGKNVKAAAAPRLTSRKERDDTLYDLMDDWREEVFDRDWARSELTPIIVLPEALMTKISFIQYPLQRTTVERILKADWFFFDRYGKELLDRLFPSAPPSHLLSDAHLNVSSTLSTAGTTASSIPYKRTADQAGLPQPQTDEAGYAQLDKRSRMDGVEDGVEDREVSGAIASAVGITVKSFECAMDTRVGSSAAHTPQQSSTIAQLHPSQPSAPLSRAAAAREFSPSPGMPLDLRHMQLVVPCNQLQSNAACSVAAVLTSGAVEVDMFGTVAVTRKAQVICVCALLLEAHRRTLTDG